MEENEKNLQLIEEIIGKNQKSLEQFYQLNQSSVYNYAYKILSDAHLAADIVNEVMMEVWRSAASFKGTAKVKSWLIRIAHNKSVDLLRKRKPQMYVSEENIKDEPVDTGDQPEVCLDYFQNSEWVRRCMEKLSEKHKQVMHLTFFEDMNYTEIADVLDTPSGTIKTRMMHAKKSIYKCLEALHLT